MLYPGNGIKWYIKTHNCLLRYLLWFIIINILHSCKI